MATPNPVTFPPLTKGFSWTPSATGAGQPLPDGEVYTSATIGIRADGDLAHSAGNYATLVIVSGAATAETVAALNATLGKSLSPGNYWAAVDQTDTLNGQSATSPWSTEAPFSIPQPIVTPDQPTGFTAA